MAINDKQDSVITEIKLAQWQTCVEMANAVSARRDNLNNLFVTVNLALAAAISLVWDVKTKEYCRLHFREVQLLLDAYERSLFIKAMRTF